MKYRDSQGNLQDLVLKGQIVGDTLPIGAEVEYSGAEVPVGWEEVDDEKVLYENSTGSNGDITLSESASNYKKLDIIYRGGASDLRENVSTIYMNNQTQNTSLSKINSDSSGGIYFYNRDITISGTSITNYGTRYSSAYINTNNYANSSNSNEIYILKVIGYK